MKVIIAAGGTGGHVYPAKLVAEKLDTYGHSIFWIGKKGSLEEKIASDADFKFIELFSIGFLGKGILEKVYSLIRLFINIMRSLILLLNIRPGFVFSTGGYTSLSVGIASWILKIPLFIHEQNSVSGLSNRILNKISTKTFVAFKGSFQESSKVILVGNPIRKDFFNNNMNYSTDKHSINLLVLGGSQGSEQLNRIFLKALKNIKEKDKLQVVHQSGELEKETVKEEYKSLGIKSEVFDFRDDIAKLYLNSDLIISRAGAMTISEIIASEKPSILLPLPWASNNHQFHNAKLLEDKGAAYIINSDPKNYIKLSEILNRLISDELERERMSNSARILKIFDSTEKIIDEINEFLRL
tara:strand:- start:18628 stop:19692 length:1065 start_codon:yes stop_codon:yes gene_type:complete